MSRQTLTTNTGRRRGGRGDEGKRAQKLTASFVTLFTRTSNEPSVHHCPRPTEGGGWGAILHLSGERAKTSIIATYN